MTERRVQGARAPVSKSPFWTIVEGFWQAREVGVMVVVVVELAVTVAM